MTRQKPDVRFTAATRAALIATVERSIRTPHRYDPPPHPLGAPTRARPHWLAGAIASAVIAVIVVAITALVLHSPGRGTTAAIPSANTRSGHDLSNPARISCGKDKGDAYRPFGCAPFTSTSARDDHGAIRWFTTDPITVSFLYGDHGPQLGINTPCNFYQVGLTLTTTWLHAHTASGSTTTMGCRNNAAALEDQAIAFFNTPVAYSLAGIPTTGKTLTLSNGTTQIRLAQPVPTSPYIVTTPAGDVSFQALLHGTLQLNSHGCVAVANTVLVVPTGSTVTGRTVTIRGHRKSGAGTYQLGQNILLGGGAGWDPHAAAPPHDIGIRCGTHAHYWFFS